MGGWGDDREPGGDAFGHGAEGPAAGGHAAGAPLRGWEEDLSGPDQPHAPAHLPSGEQERLGLDEGDRLPWLEGEEDEYYERVSPGRVIAAGLGALVLVGAVVGGIWWMTHHHALNAPAPDGSTVTPPAAQYKEAPANPGGRTFQGTGDTSYVVSQGQNRQAQLADGDDSAVAGAAAGGAAAATGGDGKRAGAAAPVAASPGAADAAPAGGVVQVGAFSSKDLAEAGWSRLVGQHPFLGQQHHRILQGQADIGTVWRLQVLTGADGGNALCDRLRAEGVSCQVKR